MKLSHEQKKHFCSLCDVETISETYLREHKDHLVIDKLYRGEAITEEEIRSLEEHLFQQGEMGDREKFKEAYGDSK